MAEKLYCAFRGLIMSIATDSPRPSAVATGEDSCVFCFTATSEGPLPGLVSVRAHVDSSVRSAMIIPTRHVELMCELTPDEWQEISRTIEHLRRAWSDSSTPADANVVWNLGRSAGQSVAHLHCHVLERHADGPLPGFGPRWWLKRDLRGTALLRLLALMNRHTRAGGFR